MAIRYDDTERTIQLSVRDLAESVSPSGHLVSHLAQSSGARLALGREIHQRWQAHQAEEHATYQAEISVEHTLQVGEWSVRIAGRVDGMLQEGDHTVVEEVKSTALDAQRLMRTGREDWPSYIAQLEIYLWMLQALSYPRPEGRLVFISVLDGSRHILGVSLDHAGVTEWVHRRLVQLVRDRERRLAWLAHRRQQTVPPPFQDWRPGQTSITGAVQEALDQGTRLMVQAPTGLGKTAAMLHGALTHALAHNRQIFWATSRNTQQASVVATLEQFKRQGLALSYVTLKAKEKLCLNEIVSCRPDTCPYARDYYAKLEDAEIVHECSQQGGLTHHQASELGRAHQVCPYELSLDVSEHVDVIIGDVNYALSPHSRLKRHFHETNADRWIVIVDEAHQLVERAREHASPRIDAEEVRLTYDLLAARDPEKYAPFLDLCSDILGTLLDVCDATACPAGQDEAEASLTVAPWKAIAQRIDSLALDYALLRADDAAITRVDPWHELAWTIMRFADAIETAGEEHVVLARTREGRECVRMLCLDPSRHLESMITPLGGFLACSATLTPPHFYRSLLGLPENTPYLDVPSPFPPERCSVIVAPRISTMWRDREAQRVPTARLIQGLVEVTPGNTAVYFPSFAMMEAVLGDVDVTTRSWLIQTRGLDDVTRAAWMERLADSSEPVVLAAVLGGIFAEGIDLPAGALDSVIIIGPAAPPIGLERDLLREYYEENFDSGHLFASLVPGMTRVIQATGRLIRRPEDRGTIVLVGKRFRWRDHARLLPSHWTVITPDEPIASARAFWHGPP